MTDAQTNEIALAAEQFLEESLESKISQHSKLKDLITESVMLLELALFLERKIGHSIPIATLLQSSELSLRETIERCIENRDEISQ